MFKRKNNTVITHLIEQINEATTQLGSLTATDEEYSKTIDQIERLHKLLAKEREGFRVSPDTLIIVAGNLLGIVLILNYERLVVITSKAVGFVGKFKL